MAKNLIEVSDKNRRIFGYADQAIFSKNSSIQEIFVSVYCYDTAAGNIRPVLDTRPDDDSNIELNFIKENHRYRLCNNIKK